MGAFSAPLPQFESDLALNVTSVFVAAQEAIAGFEELPKETPKSFIYTGNRLNIEPMPVLLSLGVGKSAGAHLMQAASMTYGAKGFK